MEPALKIERTQVMLRPLAFLTGAEAETALAQGLALPLAGGPGAFCAVLVLLRDVVADFVMVRDLPAALAALPAALQAEALLFLDRLTAPRPPLELGDGRVQALDRPLIMGVVNVTPDSFSDGGHFFDPAAAIAHGRVLAAEGADILDIGGESTRPGAEPVTTDEEVRRILPVIAGLRDLGVALSVDSRHGATLEAAVAAGATILNDISALRHDPASLGVAVAAQRPVVLMHALGDPQTMQVDPQYDDVLFDVFDMLRATVGRAEAAGLPRSQLIIDPGIGFGKTVGHNVDLLAGLALFHGLGCPLLLGVSRKSFIARLSAGETPGERLPGSLAAALEGVAAGAHIVRVHDVAETVQALKVRAAILNGLA